MAVTTINNTFTSNVVGESASPLVAGVVSYNGLIPLFGTTGSNGTSETEIGIMTVSSLTDWTARLNKTQFRTTGPTGAWAGEWWAINNYLLYGGSCIVGGTGSTGDYYFSSGVLGITKTPLHNKSLAKVNVIFEAGNTFSAGAAVNAAMSRQDCIAIIGNRNKISGIPLSANYDSRESDFGVTLSSEYVMYVAGRKKFTAGVGTSVRILESNLSPDVAGCVARSAKTNIWVSPAGKIRGRILGVVSMQQNFSDTDSQYLLGGDVNPIMVFPGEGTFFMGNQTSYTSTGPLEKINTTFMVIYVKNELLRVAQDLLFEINNASTRQRFVNSATPILEYVKTTNGIQNYRIVCDDTNNTTQTVAEGKLIADIYVQPSYAAETIVITIINTDTSEAFTG
jgi:phage tail sheath protein FI